MSEWYEVHYDDNPGKSDITMSEYDTRYIDIYVKQNDSGNVYVSVKTDDIIKILDKYNLIKI